MDWVKQNMPLVANILILFSVIGIIYFIVKDKERQNIIDEKRRLRNSLMKDDKVIRDLLKNLRSNHTTNLELDGFDHSVKVLG